MIFDQLALWIDPVARTGPEAMAVDEWLLESAASPVLRVYRWLGAWGSVGYFGRIAEARAAFPDVDWVRRWTGGGIVDHRADWTYTVVAPAGSRLAGLRGAESYRLVHAALAEALAVENLGASLSSGHEQTGSLRCFENPVAHDLIGGDKRKLAGAGQRRNRHGLLHQGSAAAACSEGNSAIRAGRLAARLAREWSAVDIQPPSAAIEARVNSRYGHPAWTERC